MKIWFFLLIGLVVLLTACKSDTEEVTVEVEDTTGPILSLSVPMNEAIGVEVDAQISLYFDELLGGDIPINSVQLRDVMTDDLVSSALDTNGSALVITPVDKLSYEREYYIESDYEITDSVGNSIEEPIYFSFTTQEPPVVAIDNIVEGQKISGIVNIRGTANDQVQQVLVQLSDSAFVEASGTANWSISIDTSSHSDGATSITAKATNGYWDIAQESLNVEIENIDPLVGIWDWQSGNIGYGHIIFHESGVYDESNGTIFFSFARSWNRESDNIFTIQRSTAGPLTVSASLSNGSNNLNLSWSTSNGSYSVNYLRR